jgi:hypothetical protein
VALAAELQVTINRIHEKEIDSISRYSLRRLFEECESITVEDKGLGTYALTNTVTGANITFNMIGDQGKVELGITGIRHYAERLKLPDLEKSAEQMGGIPSVKETATAGTVKAQAEGQLSEAGNSQRALDLLKAAQNVLRGPDANTAAATAIIDQAMQVLREGSP